MFNGTLVLGKIIKLLKGNTGISFGKSFIFIFQLYINLKDKFKYNYYQIR
tara:strand:+ start:763 stop:912 length:150 start_codon:yes stop_codon:yes gene_type:complete